MSEQYPYRIKRQYHGITIDVKARTKKEASAKFEKKKAEIDRKHITTGGKTTLNRWSEVYFEKYVEGKVKDITLDGRKGIYHARIQPYLGALPMHTIKASDCQDVLNKMSGYAKDSIAKTSQLMFNLFRYAKREGLIGENPADDLVMPSASSGHGRACTPVESALLLHVADYHEHGLWALCMYYLGMRPNETSLLLGSHINYQEGLVFIDGTKSVNARRIVPCPNFLLEKLSAAKTSKTRYVFTNMEGYQHSSNNRTRWWKSLKREMNIQAGCAVYRNQIVEPLLPDDFVPYCCRHSFATNLKDAGVPYSLRQELLGHSASSVTDRYTHRTEDSLRQAAAIMDAYYQEHAKKMSDIFEKIQKKGVNSIEDDIPSADLIARFFPDAE